MRGCGGYAYDIRKIRPFYLYNIASTSVLADHYYLVQNFDDYEFNDAFSEEDIQQSYIHGEIHLKDSQKSIFSGVYKTGNVPKNIQRELNRVSRYLQRRKDKYKDYKVEIITQDNKKFECKPIEYLDQIHLPIDVFSYRGDY